MKTVFVGLIALAASITSTANASSIDSSCSDAAQSFTLRGHGSPEADVVRIRTSYNGASVELSAYEEQVAFEFKNEIVLPEEHGNGWFTRSSVYTMTIRPVGKTVLPDAYSRLKNKDGSLTETVICKTSFVSSPRAK